MTLSPEQQAEVRTRHNMVQTVTAATRFPVINNEIAHGSQLVDRLRGRLASEALRAYAYHAVLSAQVSAAISRWEAMVSAVLVARDQEAAPLTARAAALYKLFTHWQTVSGNAGEYARRRGQIDGELVEMQRAISAAEARLTAIYAEAKDGLDDLVRECESVEWTVTAVERAQLALPSGEAVFIACKAEWVSANRKDDDPDGVLFLTNNRLLFEQAEQKSGFLGLLGRKQDKNDGGVLWAVALADIVEMEDDRAGLFGSKSVVTLRLSAGAPFPEMVLHIKGGFGGEQLLGYIKRAQSGALAQHGAASASKTATAGGLLATTPFVGAQASAAHDAKGTPMNGTPNQPPAAPAKPKPADPLDDARALADQLDAWVNAADPADREKLTPIVHSPQFERAFFFALQEEMLSDKALEYATQILCEAKRRHPIAAALRTNRLSDATRQQAEAVLAELVAASRWHPYERGDMFITEKFAETYDDIEPTGRVNGGLPVGTLVSYGGAEFGKLFLIDARTGKYYYAVFLR